MAGQTVGRGSVVLIRYPFTDLTGFKPNLDSLYYGYALSCGSRSSRFILVHDRVLLPLIEYPAEFTWSMSSRRIKSSPARGILGKYHDIYSISGSPTHPPALRNLSEEEICNIIASENYENDLLKQAIYTAGETRAEAPIRHLLERIESFLSAVDIGEETKPLWIATAVPVLVKSGLTEALDLVEKLAEYSTFQAAAALSLADAASTRAIPHLEELMVSSGDDVLRSRIASVLKNVFDSNFGLSLLAPDLESARRMIFRRAFDAFFMVHQEQRDGSFLLAVESAMHNQRKAEHLVTLMYLLKRTAERESAVTMLAEYLEDRRKARDLLSPAGRGEVRDYAVFYIAANLWPNQRFRTPRGRFWPRMWGLHRRVKAALEKNKSGHDGAI